MNAIFQRTAEGASVGGIIGAAIGALVAGTTTVATAGLAAPIMFAAAVGNAAVGSASSGAIGTLIGGGIGAAAGTAETIHYSRCEQTESAHKKQGNVKTGKLEILGTDILAFAASLITASGKHTSRFTGDKYNQSWKKPHNFGEIPFVDKTVRHGRFAFPYQYDRTWRADDGVLYYGIDREGGSTDWYNEEGGPEGRTDTPLEYEQDENNYRNDGYGAKCPYCNGTGYDFIDGGQCEYCDGLGERR